MVEATEIVALVLASVCLLALVAMGVFVSQLKSRLDALLDERGAIKKSALPPDAAAGPKPSAPKAAGAAQEQLVEELKGKLTAAEETIRKADAALQALAARVLTLEQPPPPPSKPLPSREPAALPLPSPSIQGGEKQVWNKTEQQGGAPAPPPRDAAAPPPQDDAGTRDAAVSHWRDDDAARLVDSSARKSPINAMADDVVLRADIGFQDPTTSNARYQPAARSESKAPALWAPPPSLGEAIAAFPKPPQFEAPGIEASARPAPPEARMVKPELVKSEAGGAPPVPILAIQTINALAGGTHSSAADSDSALGAMRMPAPETPQRGSSAVTGGTYSNLTSSHIKSLNHAKEIGSPLPSPGSTSVNSRGSSGRSGQARGNWDNRPPQLSARGINPEKHPELHAKEMAEMTRLVEFHCGDSAMVLSRTSIKCLWCHEAHVCPPYRPQSFYFKDVQNNRAHDGHFWSCMANPNVSLQAGKGVPVGDGKVLI